MQMKAYMNPLQFLKKVVKKQYISLYDKNWYSDLNQKQKQGFHLLMAIYKNKGNKKFRNKPPSIVLKNLASKEVHRYQKFFLIG